MERTTLLRAMKPLQETGLIRRDAVAASTAHSLHLTKAGEARIQTASPLWQAAQTAFEQDIGKDRAITLRDTVNAIDFKQ